MKRRSVLTGCGMLLVALLAGVGTAAAACPHPGASVAVVNELASGAVVLPGVVVTQGVIVDGGWCGLAFPTLSTGRVSVRVQAAPGVRQRVLSRPVRSRVRVFVR